MPLDPLHHYFDIFVTLFRTSKLPADTCKDTCKQSMFCQILWNGLISKAALALGQFMQNDWVPLFLLFHGAEEVAKFTLIIMAQTLRYNATMFATIHVQEEGRKWYRCFAKRMPWLWNDWMSIFQIIREACSPLMENSLEQIIGETSDNSRILCLMKQALRKSVGG